MNTPGNHHDGKDRQPHGPGHQQMSSGRGQQRRAQPGGAHQAVAQRDQPVAGIEHQCPAGKQRATDMPVVEQVEHGCSGGQRGPAGDDVVAEEELGDAADQDGDYRQIAPGWAGQIADLLGLLALRMTFLHQPVDHAHGHPAGGDDDQRHDQAHAQIQPGQRITAAARSNKEAQLQQGQRCDRPGKADMPPLLRIPHPGQHLAQQQYPQCQVQQRRWPQADQRRPDPGQQIGQPRRQPQQGHLHHRPAWRNRRAGKLRYGGQHKSGNGGGDKAEQQLMTMPHQTAAGHASGQQAAQHQQPGEDHQHRAGTGQ